MEVFGFLVFIALKCDGRFIVLVNALIWGNRIFGNHFALVSVKIKALSFNVR